MFSSRCLLVLLLMMSLSKSYSQEIVKVISKSVGLVSFNDRLVPGSLKFGTGTLMIKQVNGDEYFVFLVTNTHVLPNNNQSDSIRFRIRNPNDDLPKFFDLKIQIFDSKGKRNIDVKDDPDGNDLSVINVSSFFISNRSLLPIVNHMFTDRFLIGQDSASIRQVNIGDDILFAGFPELFYDKRNISPLVRSGIIASDPSDDYYFNDDYRNNFFLKFQALLPEKLNGFLIDANVFGGSSGSLVFTKPKVMRLDKEGKPEYYQGKYSEVFVLGILTYSYINIVDSLNQRVQLGGVISAGQILKTMNLFKP